MGTARRASIAPEESIARRISRRRFLALSGGALAAFALSSRAMAPAPEAAPQPPMAGDSKPMEPPVVPSEPGSSEPHTPSSDLDRMIGQMVMVGFRGLAVDERSPIARDLREHQLGGVFLFEQDFQLIPPVRNVKSAQQLKALDAALQELASTPLLIGIDQEGGKTNRLKEQYGFPPFPSAQSLGSQNDLARTHAVADLTARTLSAAGINLNLAPDVDVNVNPFNPIIGKVERSFSSNPAIVSAHAREWIRAHHAHVVLTTLKHFPGHGSSRDDSHLGFVDVTETWSRKELEPFASIIAAGEADVVMTAHIFNAKLDAELPATLSKNVIGSILRGELGYDGVVMSDDMQMQAITKYYGFEAAIELAINAGVDILAFANNLVYDPDIGGRATSVVKALVASGRISGERIEQSYQRIARLKQRLQIP